MTGMFSSENLRALLDVAYLLPASSFLYYISMRVRTDRSLHIHGVCRHAQVYSSKKWANYGKDLLMTLDG